VTGERLVSAHGEHLVSGGHLEVLAPGLLTTVQDVVGRVPFARLGVPGGGAMDRPAARLANRLVGNPAHAALLEATLVGPSLRIDGCPRVIALTGADLSATLDDRPLRPGWSVYARTGAVLSFGERRAGVRAYIAVQGGIEAPLVLGSRATDLLSGFGGLAGRALRAGDQLLCGPAISAEPAGRSTAEVWRPPDPDAAVRILPGPHVDSFAAGALAALCAGRWTITQQADRMGYRLAGGAALEHLSGADVPSLGLPSGAIQVPADGQPIVLLADHQPTGGYTVLATVIQADLHVLAQRGPGDSVQFQASTVEEARLSLGAQREELPLVGDEPEFAAGWA
jgi:biotin-dependent carboxylase-like uncharacterized protein